MLGIISLAKLNNNQENFQYTIRRLAEGASIRQIGRELKVHNSTVQYWIKNNFKTDQRTSSFTQEDVLRVCNSNSADYAYVLGSYLGDGTISLMPKTYRLRIFNDSKYPDIISDQKRSLGRLFAKNKILEVKVTDSKCLVVSMYSNHLPLFFPQHGPRAKHTRDVSLKEWQWVIIKKEPECFIKGLIDSDGTYYTHTQKAKNGKEHFHQRYSFTNTSKDIINAMENTLSLLDISYFTNKKTVQEKSTPAKVVTIAKKQEVEKMDNLYTIAEAKLRDPSS